MKFGRSQGRRTMTIKKGVKDFLTRIGVNVTRVPAPHLLSHHVKNFIRDSQINLVLDVGAYHGAYCKLLRAEASYRGMIVSFEPCAASFRQLKKAMVSDGNWRGY